MYMYTYAEHKQIDNIYFVMMLGSYDFKVLLFCEPNMLKVDSKIAVIN